MSARLSMAIRIAEAAKSILWKTRSFPERQFGEMDDERRREHVGVEPMLLALSMELALKAWFVFDFDNPNFPWSHDLDILFERLEPGSKDRLDNEFKKSVAPYHPSGFHIDYGIRHVLFQHKDSFVDWRYLHEAKADAGLGGGPRRALHLLERNLDEGYRPGLVRWPRLGFPTSNSSRRSNGGQGSVEYRTAKQ